MKKFVKLALALCLTLALLLSFAACGPKAGPEEFYAGTMALAKGVEKTLDDIPAIALRLDGAGNYTLAVTYNASGEFAECGATLKGKYEKTEDSISLKVNEDTVKFAVKGGSLKMAEADTAKLFAAVKSASGSTKEVYVNRVYMDAVKALPEGTTVKTTQDYIGTYVNVIPAGPMIGNYYCVLHFGLEDATATEGKYVFSIIYDSGDAQFGNFSSTLHGTYKLDGTKMTLSYTFTDGTEKTYEMTKVGDGFKMEVAVAKEFNKALGNAAGTEEGDSNQVANSMRNDMLVNMVKAVKAA